MYLGLKLLHLAGVMLFFSGLCGTLMMSYTGSVPLRPRALLLTRLCYVSGMLIIVVSGLLTLSQLGLLSGGIPLWAKLKFGVVALFVPGVLLANRKGTPAWVMIPIYVLLGAGAAALALFKPT